MEEGDVSHAIQHFSILHFRLHLPLSTLQVSILHSSSSPLQSSALQQAAATVIVGAQTSAVTIAVKPRPQQPPSPVHHHRRGHQSNPAEATFTTVEKQQSQVGLHQRFQEIEKLWEEVLKRVVTRRKILDFSF
nr:hypothetical protein Iba_chr05bCG12350 [Ipomoea batatas]